MRYIWGDPLRLALTAYATKVGIERYTSIFSDLPILLDETSTVPEKLLRDILYMLANEVGKLRGKKDGGLQDTPTWKTIAFFTGEAPITSSKSFQGQKVRTIELSGGLNANAPEAVDGAAECFKENYGLMGPLVIKRIFEMYEKLIPIYQEAKKELKKSVIGSAGYASRLTDRFAAIMVGASIFEKIWEELGFPPHDTNAVIVEIFQETLLRLNSSNYTDRAIIFIQSWVASNWNFFFQSHESKEEMEEKRGHYQIMGQISPEYIDIYPHLLYNELEKNDFSPDRILKDLKKREVIKTQKGGNQISVRIDGNVQKVVRFFREKLVEGEEL